VSPVVSFFHSYCLSLSNVPANLVFNSLPKQPAGRAYLTENIHCPFNPFPLRNRSRSGRAARSWNDFRALYT